MSATTTTRPSTTTAASVVQNDTGAATVKVTKKHSAKNATTTFEEVAAQAAANTAMAAAEAKVAAVKQTEKEKKAAAKQADALVKTVTANETYKLFDQLVAEREYWQENAFRTSNDQLYALLQKCYQFYSDMSKGDAKADGMRDGLNNYIALKGYIFSSATHTITKIVKCVFGVDRRRVSAYSIALRFALSSKIEVQDLPAFIYDNGGVEQLRLAKSPTVMTPKQKAEIAKDAVCESHIAVVNSKKLGQMLDAGKVNTNIVLIGTWQADGSVIVRAVVQNDGVVNAALASYYSANKAEEQAQAAERKAANDSNATRDAIKNATMSA
jgi:hypothetical protein